MADTAEELAIFLEDEKKIDVGQEHEARGPWLKRLFSRSPSSRTPGRVAPKYPPGSFPTTIEAGEGPVAIHNLVERLDGAADADRALPSALELTAAPVHVEVDWAGEGNWAGPPVTAQQEYCTAAGLGTRRTQTAVGTGMGADGVEACRVEEIVERVDVEVEAGQAGDGEVVPACGVALQASLPVVAEFRV
jgi:hypothetical protein